MTSNKLDHQGVLDCIKAMDEAAVPYDLGMSIVAYPWETNQEAWARVRRVYLHAQYDRIFP